MNRIPALPSDPSVTPSRLVALITLYGFGAGFNLASALIIGAVEWDRAGSLWWGSPFAIASFLMLRRLDTLSKALREFVSR